MAGLMKDSPESLHLCRGLCLLVSVRDIILELLKIDEPVDPVSEVDYFTATAHKVRCTRPSKLQGNFGPVICWATGLQQLLGAVGQGLAGALAAGAARSARGSSAAGWLLAYGGLSGTLGGVLIPIGTRPFPSPPSFWALPRSLLGSGCLAVAHFPPITLIHIRLLFE